MTSSAPALKRSEASAPYPWQPVFCAAVTALIAVMWLWLTVHFNYGDNWSALFYTGAQSTIPPQLGDEDVFQFKNSVGYDGQFYHFIAHDPFFQRGVSGYVDNPRLRYRRILLPALSYVLVLGNEDYVDSVYIGIVVAFVGLGAWWLGQYASFHRLSGWWGITFLTIPAVLVSLDRMTVDVALAALAIAFAFYGETEQWWPFAAVLSVAPLVRETGLILIAAACVWKWRQSLLWIACAIPFACWEIFLRLHTNSDQTVYTNIVPFSAIIARTVHPVQFPLTTKWLQIACFTDYMGLIGIWIALAGCAVLAIRRRFELVPIAAVLFGCFAALLGNPQIWADDYAFARTLSPLLIWLALWAIRTRIAWYALPLLCTQPRILLQFEPQLKRVIHG